MKENKSLDVFENAPVHKAVFQNALPAMAAMLMVLIYNLADTFFIGQTHDDLQVAAVSLATPVFLLFMAVGTIFGIGGTSVISRVFFLYVELCWSWHYYVNIIPVFYGADSFLCRRKCGHMGIYKNLSHHC